MTAVHRRASTCALTPRQAVTHGKQEEKKKKKEKTNERTKEERRGWATDSLLVLLLPQTGRWRRKERRLKQPVKRLRVERWVPQLAGVSLPLATCLCQLLPSGASLLPV